MAADGKRKTTGALGVVLALALTVVVAGGALRFRRAHRADRRSPLARAHTVGGRRGERV